MNERALQNSIRLKHKNWEALVLPGFGANVISLKDNGVELLRSPKSMEELKASPYLYGMPLLFTPNRTEGGKFCFDGKEYHMEINEPDKNNHLHGFMFDAPFEAAKVSSGSVECTYQNNGERYPFPFRMVITYTLHDDGFRQDVEIRNTSKDDIPVLLAFHTTFAEPESFCVPIEKRLKTNENLIPTGELVDLNREEQEYAAGCSSKDKEISGFYTAKGQTARVGDYFYTASDHFTHWVLYNGGGDQSFLCIEPQSGPVNGLNIPGGHIRLKRGENVRFWTTITK